MIDPIDRSRTTIRHNANKPRKSNGPPGVDYRERGSHASDVSDIGIIAKEFEIWKKEREYKEERPQTRRN